MNLVFSFPDVANAWLETLLDVIELLPKDVIKREVSGNMPSIKMISTYSEPIKSCFCQRITQPVAMETAIWQ